MTSRFNHTGWLAGWPTSGRAALFSSQPPPPPPPLWPLESNQRASALGAPARRRSWARSRGRLIERAAALRELPAAAAHSSAGSGRPRPRAPETMGRPAGRGPFVFGLVAQAKQFCDCHAKGREREGGAGRGCEGHELGRLRAGAKAKWAAR